MAHRPDPPSRGDLGDRGDPGCLIALTSVGAVVAEEMLSGPDLGGGYLHQLTVDAAARPARFTYHAQVGGADASGPPLGPLDPFDFVHPNLPCAFGGPRCWHRSFEAGPERSPEVRQAYNRFRFVLATLMEQRYAARAAAVDSALTELLARLHEDPPSPEHAWYVGGSAAAWLQGAKIAPRDIDLGTAPGAVAWVASGLKEYLIEPLARTTWANDRPFYAARAFVGTLRDGARVEWASPQPAPDPCPRWDEWTVGASGVRSRSVQFHGRPLQVSRPEYAFVRALEHGSGENARAIAEATRAIGADLELLDELLSRSALPLAERTAARAEMRR